MLKLPSPSVVCAQNSPVIFTMGFTRVRSMGMAAKRSRTSRSAAIDSVAEKLVQELAEIFGRARKARLLEQLAPILPRSVQGLLAAHHFVQQFHGFFEHAVGLVRRSLRRGESGRRRRS